MHVRSSRCCYDGGVYGNGGTATDVAVNSYKQVSTSGEYGEIASVAQDYLRVNDVNWPYTFLEYTIENHSTQTVSNVPYQVVMDVPGMGRIVLATHTYRMGPGYTGTFAHYVRIPTSIPDGGYRIWVFADYKATLADANRANNAVLMPRAVNVDFVPNTPSGGFSIGAQ